MCVFSLLVIFIFGGRRNACFTLSLLPKSLSSVAGAVASFTRYATEDTGVSLFYISLPPKIHLETRRILIALILHSICPLNTFHAGNGVDEHINNGCAGDLDADCARGGAVATR